MVAVGSKAPLRKLKTSSLTEDSCMAGEDNPYGRRIKKGRMNRKSSFDGDQYTENLSGGVPAKNIKDSKISKYQEASLPQTSFVRKPVDPETAKYYSEIENVIEGTEDLEKKGCDVDHLCELLQSCAKDFPGIAMDRSGSHVAETALKSVPLASPEFHVMKSSGVLAERLNFMPSRFERNASEHLEQGFPDLLKFFMSGMLNCSRKDVSTLQTDQYSSLVWQTALKVLVGHEEELLRIIPILLGCKMENVVEGNFIEITSVQPSKFDKGNCI
ncbi:pumilio 23 [Actinidia rufa]|uniref:Pumilio 23 n=1 Tax=Actinidia rufa TaxID=165716 RepID=A0A7J0G147_9ERIC|nr:pumilio 23 [Actinidia rufa]